jgi:hypothetical protein
MRTLSRRRFALLLPAILPLLAACPATVTRPPPSNVTVRPITSATVTWMGSSSILTHYLQRRGGGGYEMEEYVRKNVASMFTETRTQLVSAVEAHLRERGIPPGDDATIFLMPEEASHGGNGAGGTIRMTVQLKDATTPGLWNVQSRATRSAIDTDRTVAEKFVRKVLEELDASGLLGPKR